MFKRILVSLLCGSALVAYSQSISKYEYWVDYDVNNRISEVAYGGIINFDLDVSSLSNGYHFLCFRLMDSIGLWSAPQTTIFLKPEKENPNRGISKYEYWLDFDFENRQSVSSDNGLINLGVDVNSMCEGMHFLCFRAQDLQGNWSVPQTTFFLRAKRDEAPNVLTQYEYWFDFDFDNRQSVAFDNGLITLDLDVNSMCEGMHFLCFRSQDLRGSWSAPQTTIFLRAKYDKEPNILTQYEYWLDFDFENRQSVSSDNGLINLNIDVNSMCEGMHFLCFRSQDLRGSWSAPQTAFFLKAKHDEAPNILTQYEYWLDFDFENRQIVASDNGLITLDVDVDSMCEGMHFFCFRSQDLRGSWSAPQTTFFLKAKQDEAPNVLTQYEYWLDFDFENRQIVASDNGLITLDVDVNSMCEGMHFLCFRLQDLRGSWSAPQTTFFLKAQYDVEPNVLTQYEYWLDFDFDNRQTVSSDKGLINLDVDVDSMCEGMHFFCFRSQDLRGNWSAPQTTFFLKTKPEIEPNVLTKYEYWLDYEFENRQTVSSDNGLITLEVDVESLDEGKHFLCFRSQDSRGNWSAPQSTFFVKSPSLENVIMGDANGDSLVNVTDIATTIDEILGKDPANLVFVAADVDRDKEISVADAALITDLALGIDISSYLNSMRVAQLDVYYPSLVSVDDLIIRNNHDETLYIQVEDFDSFIAAQLDMHLPEGLSISDVALVGENSASHSIVWRRLGQGNDYRLIAFSMSNHNFSSSDIVAVTFHADENAAVDGTNIILNNIVLNSYDEQQSIIRQEFVADAICSVYGDITNTTQVANDDWSLRVEGLNLYIKVPSTCTKVLTDTLGRFCVLYLREGENVVGVLSKGVYILDGKKIIVK